MGTARQAEIAQRQHAVHQNIQRNEELKQDQSTGNGKTKLLAMIGTCIALAHDMLECNFVQRMRIQRSRRLKKTQWSLT